MSDESEEDVQVLIKIFLIKERINQTIWKEIQDCKISLAE